MSLELGQNAYERLHEWYAQGPSEKIYSFVSEYLTNHIQTNGLERYLQLGRIGYSYWSLHIQSHEKWLIDKERGKECHLQCEYDLLPFKSDCVDLIIIPHSYEYDINVYGVLAECYRILKPEGHMLILGFNPYSLNKMMDIKRAHSKIVPWNGQPVAILTLRKFLSDIGFKFEHIDYIGYSTLQSKTSPLRYFYFMESLGHLLFPFLGDLFVLIVRKEVIPLTPIKLKWQTERTFWSKNLPEPTAHMVEKNDS